MIFLNKTVSTYSDKEIKEVIESCKRHIKKYGFRKTSIEELDKLFRDE